MPKKTVREMSNKERRRYSLSARTFHTVLMICALLSIAAVAFGYYLFSSSVDKDYRVSTWRLAKTAAHVTDPTEIREIAEPVIKTYEALSDDEKAERDNADYLAKFIPQNKNLFARICQQIRDIQADNDARAAYIAALDTENSRMLFIADADESSETNCPPGYWDSLSEEYMQAFLNGTTGSRLDLFYGTEPIPSIIGEVEHYGLRCTAGAELFEIDGYPVYVFFDTDMNNVRAVNRRFLTLYILLLAAATVLIALFAAKHLKKTVVAPIDALADAANNYVNDRNDVHRDGKHFEKLDIRTGDEIENLAWTMKEMESDLAGYIQNLTEVTAEKERIGTELGIASAIQEGILPSIFPPYPDRPEFDLYAGMKPAKEVGGDFYDFFLVDDDHLGLVIADVSGKGVPAALFMMASKMMIKNYATMTSSLPAQVLEQVNHQICLSNSADMFVTAWIGILEISSGKMAAANAGHEYPALMRSGGKFDLLKDHHGFVLGGVDGIHYKGYEVQLNPGDALFLYTDGVTEATDADEEMFGVNRMLDTLNLEPESSPMALIGTMSGKLTDFTGESKQFDDITMLAVRYKGNKGSKMTIEAKKENLEKVIDFVNEELESAGCGMKAVMQIDVAVEELFINIANYAYAPGTGNAVIGVHVEDDPHRAVITFADSGIPYDPLKKEDPDITLSADEREIGGLGIFMVKKSMDDMFYEYVDGQNKLTIIKNL